LTLPSELADRVAEEGFIIQSYRQDVYNYQLLTDHFEIGKQHHLHISSELLNYSAVKPGNRNGA
jgi:hypothetical protein